MPEVHPEVYSNPIAPPEQEQAAADAKKAKLTNDDFRKLLMTPRPALAANKQAPSVSKPSSSASQKKESHVKDDEKRQKKKSLYSQLKKEEVERQAEWAKKYRDRAQERRVGKNPDYAASDDVATNTTGYKAVAPNVDQMVVEQRRKQAIQESKFLGGDMQHTHLVKGLDYVLLNKVRSEISTKQHEDEELRLLEKKREREKPRAEFTDDLKFRTTLAKNVYRTLFLSKPPQRNELFAPRRMAYVFDLDDEYSESDIPTTLIRSLAECPTQESTTLTTNDIVINKLTQILSYLRQGSRSGRKAKRKEKSMHVAKEEPLLQVPPMKKKPVDSERIFDELEDYVFDPSSKAAASSSKDKRRTYFDKQGDHEDESNKGIHKSTEEFIRSVNKRYGDHAKAVESQEASKSTPTSSNKAGGSTKKDAKKDKAGFGGFGLEGHYAECYPGGFEEFDGNYDSDEDADYTKMDMGNKKGPVKRWDFENEEDYSNYQSEREALPKAAFQYGVKMSEGRKTRRFGGGMTAKAKEKAKLNREWQQISAILEKRKGGGEKSAAKRAKLEDD